MGLRELYCAHRRRGLPPGLRAPLVEHRSRATATTTAASPRGEQATGNPYDRGAIETCCTVAWMAMSVEMLRLTGNSLVADELELSTLNSGLGMMSPSGRWVTYNTPMDGERQASAHTIVFQARAGTPELNCCSVNGPRALGLLCEWAVMRRADGLVLNYYGPGTMRTPDGGADAAHRLPARRAGRHPGHAASKEAVHAGTAHPALVGKDASSPQWQAGQGRQRRGYCEHQPELAQGRHAADRLRFARRTSGSRKRRHRGRLRSRMCIWHPSIAGPCCWHTTRITSPPIPRSCPSWTRADLKLRRVTDRALAQAMAAVLRRRRKTDRRCGCAISPARAWREPPTRLGCR